MKVDKLHLALIIAIGVFVFLQIWGTDPLLKTNYEEKIRVLESEMEIHENTIRIVRNQKQVLQEKVTSLEGRDTLHQESIVTIKHEYNETYSIIPSASDQQLDSIIRTNW